MTNTQMTVRENTPAVAGQFTPGVISQRQAAYLLSRVWPGAPEEEIKKAALICQQYQLNPLMRQVYLIKYGNTWSVVLGIKATRQIAQKRHRYSYVDGPRMMSEQEQKEILGDVDKERFWAITKIKDAEGNIYPGYGNIPRNAQVYGMDKGNSAANLAFIRSERNALDKLAPGELPDLDVADDQYTPIGNLKVAVEAGRREAEMQVEADINELYGEDDAVPAPEPPPAPAVQSDAQYIKDGLSALGLTFNALTPALRANALFAGFEWGKFKTLDALLAAMTPDQLRAVRSEVDKRAQGRLGMEGK